MATHPPLVERIRRIEPRFNGKFELVDKIEYTPADLVEPNRLAAERAAVGVNTAALAGAQGMALAPSAAVAHVGAPRIEHLDYAQSLIASLPPRLAREVRDPLGAVAIIYALLASDTDDEVRRSQLDYLAKRADPRANEETLRIAPLVSPLPPEVKLPLVGMTLPALKRLSERQLAAFRDDVVVLIKADHRISLFEYGVQRLILKRLVARLEGQQPAPTKTASMSPLMPALNGLLSTLAYYGAADEQLATAAIAAATNALGGDSAGLVLLPRQQCGLKSVDAALDQMAAAAPAIKRRVLEACAACIGADGRVTVEEAELLRIIADALDCPMPPLLASAAA